MAIREIVLFPDERLRQKSAPVTVFDQKLKALTGDMLETMYNAPGIGLAAPQIGVSLQLATIDIRGDEEIDSSIHTPHQPLFLINPLITSQIGKIEFEEGCLSIPDVREYVSRASEIEVQAQDLDGQTFSIKASGLLSICIQHEVDHLNGILFIDHLSDLKKEIVKKRFAKKKRAK